MDRQRTRRSPARFLAPLFLIVAVIAFAMIINSSGSSDSSSADTSTSTSSSSRDKAAGTSTAAKKKAAVKKKAAAKKTYTVQAGDTFGSIASKTGLTVEQLQELNPSADSRLLQTGQQLRVQ